MLIGYQIVSNDGNEIPKGFYSFEVFEDVLIAEKWIMAEKSKPESGIFRWVIKPVFKGDIEEPKFLDCI